MERRAARGRQALIRAACAFRRYLDDLLLKEGVRHDVLWIVSWGFDVPWLIRRLSGHRVAYHAHSSGYGFALPEGVPVLAVSRNTPDWKPGDGGELRLQPFCGVAATIQPKHNRLAIFFSDRTLHRVTPSTAAKRYAVTVWLDGDFVDPRTGASTNASELNLNAREALSDIAKTAKELARGNAQRALSRAVYADEYEASLVECMGNARGADEMLQAHYEHCRSVKKNHALKTLVDALRDYRREVEASAAEVEL